MLLIYVPKLTNRLGYTLNVMMRVILRTDFAITSDRDTYLQHTEAKLCYGPQNLGEGVYLRSSNLLFETTLDDQEPHCFDYQGTPAMFPTYNQGSSLPFDPLAAAFYMLSRYEEYLPHIKDKHGRFVVTESIAYRNGFLQKAVVDRWAILIRDAILSQYPDQVFPSRHYEFIETVDIDAAYCYLHKGIVRTLMGIARDGLYNNNWSEVARRIRVLRRKEKDPFDTFDYMLDIRSRYKNFPMIFFVLLGDYSVYDKPASYWNDEFRDLIQCLSDKAKMGIHLSYGTLEEPKKMDYEIPRLKDILHREIVRNRFHFLRFALPSSFRELIRYGIKHDYSMGFAELPGFRSGTATPYPFFDISSNSECDLMIHPFVVMDTTLHTHMKLSNEEALRQYKELVDEVRLVGGQFSCLVHNQNLCEDYGWKGWRPVYEEMIRYGSENTNNKSENDD